jgi:hypothetical protein
MAESYPLNLSINSEKSILYKNFIIKFIYDIIFPMSRTNNLERLSTKELINFELYV